MSRCFPYPPPGYVKDGIRDEALIKSIKLRREQEKGKKESKKEKKREKKEKKQPQSHGDIDSKKQSHKKRKHERIEEDRIAGDIQKRVENEVEQLERSNLTEEHGVPSGSQNSADSTLNSHKRQKLNFSSDVMHNLGSIIRIKLPFQRHKDSEVVPQSKEQPSTLSERTSDVVSHGEHMVPESTLRPSEEKPCLSSQESETAVPSRLCGSCSPQLALKFRDVVENWVPTLVQSQCSDSGDHEWLFKTKGKQKCEDRRGEIDSVGLCHVASAGWSRVCYMPEADIYTLPFTVPF